MQMLRPFGTVVCHKVNPFRFTNALWRQKPLFVRMHSITAERILLHPSVNNSASKRTFSTKLSLNNQTRWDTVRKTFFSNESLCAGLMIAIGIGLMEWWPREVDIDKLDGAFKNLPANELNTLRDLYIQLQNPKPGEETDHLLRELGRCLRKHKAIITGDSQTDIPLSRCLLASLATLPFAAVSHREIGLYAAECLLQSCQLELETEPLDHLKAVEKRLGCLFSNTNLEQYSRTHQILLVKSYYLITQKILEQSLNAPIDELEKSRMSARAKALSKHNPGSPDFQYYAWCSQMVARVVVSTGSKAQALFVASITGLQTASKNLPDHELELTWKQFGNTLGFILNNTEAARDLLSDITKDTKDLVADSLKLLSPEEIRYQQVFLTTLVKDQQQVLALARQLALNPKITSALPWQLTYALLDLFERNLPPDGKLQPEVVHALHTLIDPQTPWQIRHKLKLILETIKIDDTEHQKLLEHDSATTCAHDNQLLKNAIRMTRATPSHATIDHMFSLLRDNHMKIPPPVKDFSGRQTDLHSVQELLRNNSTLAITGFGGLGKTELVHAYVQDHERDFEHILLLQAQSQHSLVASLHEIADHLEIVNMKPAERFAALKNKLATLQHSLLVIDNLDDSQIIKELAQLLPVGMKNIRLLITSRLSTIVSEHFGGDEYKLGKLPESDAVDYLLRTTSQDDPHSAQLIASKLGQLPLALRTSAAYIKKTKVPLEIFYQLLSTNIAMLHQNSSSPETVHAILNTTLDAIHDSNPLARQLIQFLGTVDTTHIPLFLLMDWMAESHPHGNNKDLLDAKGCLHDYSLLDSHEGGMVSIHPLFHYIIREDMSNSEDWEIALTLLEKRIQNCRHDEPAALKETRQLISHCRHFLEHINSPLLSEERRIILASLSRQVGRFLSFDGRNGESVHYLSSALETLSQVHQGKAQTTIATLLYELGDTLVSQKQPADGSNYLRRALAMQIALYGSKGHPETVKTQLRIARVLLTHGKYKESEEICREALAVQIKTDGQDSIPVAETLCGIANAMQAQGFVNDAEKLYLQALAIVTTQLPPKDPLIAQTLFGLAWVFRDMGKYNESKQMYRRALDLRKEIYQREDHPEIINILHKLAGVSYKEGNYEESISICQRTLNLVQKIHGSLINPAGASVLRKLATAHQAQGNYKESERLYQEALRGCAQSKVQSEIFLRGSILTQLARLMQKQQRYTESEALYQESKTILREQLEEQHPDLARIAYQQGTLCQEQGDHQKAANYYQEALNIYTVVYKDQSQPRIKETRERLQEVLAAK